MKIEKGTLFSLSNEALKKERPYSLLIMRIGFILECAFYVAIFILTFFGTLFMLSKDTSFLITFFYGLLFLVFFSVVAFLPVLALLFILRRKWRMQLWVYDLLCIPLALGCIENFLRFTSLDFVILLIIFSVFLPPIFAAWRIRSFLRGLPDTEEDTTEINTQTLHEFFLENMVKTKKNVLFSIKSDELRKKCQFSLLIIRFYFVLICLFFIKEFCIGSFSMALAPDVDTFTSFPSLLFFLELFLLWHLLELKFWAYNLMAAYSFFCFLQDMKTVMEEYINLQYLYLYLIPLIGTIAAWRVIFAFNEQSEKDIEQEDVEEHQLPMAEHTNNSTAPEKASETGEKTDEEKTSEKELEQALEEDLEKKPEKEPEYII